MPFLEIIAGDCTENQFELLGDQTVIGRHPGCDIVLDSQAVSRKHAEVVKNGDAYCVQELSSRNGTKVNGDCIDSQTVLSDGDTVTICGHVLKFQSRSSSDDGMNEAD